MSARRAEPILLIAGFVAILALARLAADRLPGFARFQQLEWMTYDWRVRLARERQPQDRELEDVAFVAADDRSVEELTRGVLLGESFGLLWARQLYGRLVRELHARGVEAIGFDVLFGERRPEHPAIRQPDGSERGSDEFFADQMREAGNVAIAVTTNVIPVALFRTNAWRVGEIGSTTDADGVIRRVRAFEDYLVWNPVFDELARRNKLRLTQSETQVTFWDAQFELAIPVDGNGLFPLHQLTGRPAAAGVVQLETAYQRARFWHLGIVMAARKLGLDLDRALVERERGRIVFRSNRGQDRVVPIDRDGCLCVDWATLPHDSGLLAQNVINLLLDDLARTTGTNPPTAADAWRGKLVLIGSTATGSNLTDLGPTPLGGDTLLVSTILNVAQSMIEGRFVKRMGVAGELGLFVALAVLSGLLTWFQRSLWVSLVVALVAVALVGAAVWAFLAACYCVPLVVPVGGGWLGTHVLLATYQKALEHRERRRIRNIFAKVVAPDVVQELLSAEKLALGGARRELTVLFADIRGFTALTDEAHARTEKLIADQHLTVEAAERLLDSQAAETLAVVNRYLAAVADAVKRHGGTLDKYIGDCVMAFWGAPTANPHHASACVRAAVDAQRAIDELNAQTREQNRKLAETRPEHAAQGLPAPAAAPELHLGTGINTGMVTVGLMGSDAHLLTYTVFGREVNLASRLEGVSGHSRIIISGSTFEALQRDAPEWAVRCSALSPVQVKGFREPIRIYEVPWRAVATSAPT